MAISHSAATPEMATEETCLARHGHGEQRGLWAHMGGGMHGGGREDCGVTYRCRQHGGKLETTGGGRSGREWHKVKLDIGAH